jgi:death-on-curing protein
MKSVSFLTLAEVIDIHRDQIQRYGGGNGLRDINLLSSAIGMPRSSFSGKFLHPALFDMAAAYAFHISQNHPFIDGNKRTALASALIFLEMNGVTIADPSQKLYRAMIALAKGTAGKADIAKLLQSLQE